VHAKHQRQTSRSIKGHLALAVLPIHVWARRVTFFAQVLCDKLLPYFERTRNARWTLNLRPCEAHVFNAPFVHPHNTRTPCAHDHAVREPKVVPYLLPRVALFAGKELTGTAGTCPRYSREREKAKGARKTKGRCYTKSFLHFLRVRCVHRQFRLPRRGSQRFVSRVCGRVAEKRRGNRAPAPTWYGH
jgi:hypothetical protein